MMGDFYHYGFIGRAGVGWLFMAAFWLLVIWVAVALVQSLSHGKEQEPDQTDKALAILKERYAKGEIDRDEYEQKKIDLLK